jgi:ribosome biogenesis GTPase
MPRRRLSERQIKRIRTIQDRRRQRLDERARLVVSEYSEEPAREGEGLVVVRHGANLAVEDVDHRVHHCLARQHIGHPVCGDRVVWQPTGSNQGVVTAIMDRRTLLSRPDYSGREKPLAANITQVIVLLAPSPDPSKYLLDQYLVAAELMGVAAMIAFNKVDLLDAERLAKFRAGFRHYEDIGYACVWISLEHGRDLEPLARKLAGETSILVGQSGVGKSSLVKSLLPNQEVQIGRLSKATGLGRHTTSAATCFRLPNGGRLIDSPGVRSFRLGAIESSELQRGFRELAPFLGQCRFGNCRHNGEPGCAVTQAQMEGRIHPERLTNFRHLAAKITNGATRL